MRKLQRLALWVGLAGIVAGCLLPGSVRAASDPVQPDLLISQLKITTGDQFIGLYNPGDQDIDDLGRFELVYVSSSGKPSIIALAGKLAARSYLLLNDGSLPLCYRMTVDSMSLGFSTTGGSLQVWHYVSSDTKQLRDSVAWAKSAAGGVLALPADPAFLQRDLTDNSWQIVQPDADDACSLSALATDAAGTPGAAAGRLLPGTPPPATIVSLSTDDAAAAAGPALPPADEGLMAPEVTEVLPNPTGTGNDASDEFIELYNPNDKVFDLSGFILQTGITTLHTYTFPAGTSLSAKSFTAFGSADTGLALSNTSGQAALLDPFANVLDSSDTYGTAKDGQAWALANGTWYWTTQPTPGAANSINQPAAAKAGKASAGTAKAKTTGGSVKGAATAKASQQAGSTGSAQDVALATPIHPWTLALVALAALLYGAYEYRVDLRNRVAQFRADRAARRVAGP